MLKTNIFVELIDTHCHLYLPEFDNDLPGIFERAATSGVKKFYLPAIDSSFMNAMVNLEYKFPKKCFGMAGLHPCSVNHNYKEELKNVENHLQKRSFAAIGEIGLDFYWSTEFSKQQYEVFEVQMQWALQKKLPIVIHTRNAMQETIDFVKPFAAKGLTGIFHCFGDSYSNAEKIIDMGFLLGIGGVLTYKKSGLDEVVKQIDLKHIVLETDAPYLTPVPFRGKRNESSYIKIIAEKLAAVKNISLEEVASITTANAEKVFSN
ncbi:MAG: TatD family hydrolase [Parafilimonas sp.]